MTYQCKTSKAKLKKLGFAENTKEGTMTAIFPIMRNGKYITLFCQVVIKEDYSVVIDVFTPDGSPYPAYYSQDTRYEFIQTTVKENIDKKFKLFGIKEKKKRGKKEE